MVLDSISGVSLFSLRSIQSGCELNFCLAHEDGCYETPDAAERSYFTLHLYLSEDAEGGATSFHSWEDTWNPKDRRDVNVEPKIGRVLIFQQRRMLHSGADVTSGTKYTFRTDIMYGKEYGRTDGIA